MDAFGKDLSNKISKITPKEINIISIIDKINSDLTLPNRGVITQIKTIEKKSIFHNIKEEPINITCLNCETKGTKDIKLTFKESHKTIWVTAKVMYKTDIIISNQTIDVMTNRLSRDKVSVVSRFVENPEQYFSDLSKINFYKLSGTIPAGTPIKTRRLIPIPLVTPSIASKVIYKSKNLSLAGVAMPMRSGKYNEMIALRHKKSKRTIYARVSGPNEVTVEL
jgi:flagella basal body P-ring formation protein FlgA